MILKDHMVVSAIESLINVCNKTGTTLYASDLNSGNKGAALSYGLYEYQDGVESGYKAIEILRDKKHPSDIPSTVIKNFTLKVNTKTMSTQGLEINKDLLFLIQSGEAI